MAKEKLQVPLKFDLNKDEFIYDMVLLSDDRTSLIKNALFYYLHEIELGKVRERHYPYGKLNNNNLILTNEIHQESILEYKSIKNGFIIHKNKEPAIPNGISVSRQILPFILNLLL